MAKFGLEDAKGRDIPPSPAVKLTAAQSEDELLDTTSYPYAEVETVNIKCDNQGAIQLGKNPIASQRSKHIDVRYHFVREHVQSGDVIFKYCATQEMVADILTKPLPRAKFVFCREKMGVMKL